MSNVIVCTGAYATTPYYIADDCIHIYCVEELCYYLYHNAYLLDDRFVTNELAVWIRDELELPGLGAEVSKIAGKYDALAKIVALLANEVGYYSEEEWRTLLSDIGRNNKLSIEERLKFRADGFLTSGRYALAMDEYEAILRSTRVSETKLRSRVYHNMGICAAKMFHFELSASYFEKAYDTYPSTNSYISMLSAKKLYMTDDEYIQYLAAHSESYEDSLEVERKVELLKNAWERQPASLFFHEMQELKGQGSAFYDGINGMCDDAKEEYREQMFRN